MNRWVVAVDDPHAPDVLDLLEQHLAFAMANTRRENVHALDLEGLVQPNVTLVSLREDGELLGVGALKQLDPDHFELKSMHTATSARRRGVGRALVEHMLAAAADKGARRVSLETGSQAAFAPARALYANCGFAACEAFGDYPPRSTSTFLTRRLESSVAWHADSSLDSK